MRLTTAEFQKWRRWMEEIVSDVTHHLVYSRQVFRHFAAVVNANSQHIEEHDGFIFVGFVRRAYVAQIAMGIRRHVKNKDDSISLMRLLEQIHRCASQFTYDFFLQQFPTENRYYDRATYLELQANTFRHYSGAGTTLSAEIVEQDMEQLQNLGARIEELADRTIAHLDNRGSDVSVTYGDLDNCIDALDRLVCKYRTLLTGGAMATLEPSILYNWKRIFTVPLDIR
jgi:hypothetical protein